MTKAEALAYIRAQYPSLTITVDSFNHRVLSGRGLPHSIRVVGHRREWMFSRSDLDRLKFRGQPRVYTVKATGKLIAFREIVPVLIQSVDELDLLRQKYGPLVNEAGLLKALQHRFRRSYTSDAIAKRRKRGAIAYVAFEEGRRGTRWYPLDQLDTLDFQKYPEKFQQPVSQEEVEQSA